MHHNSLGQRIREQRLKQGMTQIELAKDICTPSMVSQIESGRAKPSYKILSAVAERLDVPLEKLLSNVDMRLDSISNYRMARALVSAGEYTSALPLFHKLLNTSHGELSLTELLFDLSTCYLNVGRLGEADSTLEQVLELALLRQDHHLQSRTHWMSGCIDVKRKKYQLAIYKFEKALRETEKLEPTDPLLTGNIFYDLGRAHEGYGELEKALQGYTRAAQTFEDLSDWTKLAPLYFQLSQSHQQLGNFEQAIALADRATTLYQGTQHLIMTWKVDCETALLQGKSGEGEAAIRTLEAAIAKFVDCGELEEAGNAALRTAGLQIERGNLPSAKRFCDQARSLLPETPLFRGRVFSIYGQIALKQADHEEAIKCLEKASEFLKGADVFSEWEAVYHDLAHLYLHTGETQRAVQLMEEVRFLSRKELQQRGISL